MELKEGMYARTKNFGICKLYKNFFEDSIDVGIGIFPEIDGFFIEKDESKYVEKSDILKTSFNLIDLIETGDIIETPKGVFQVYYIANDVIYTYASKVIVCLRQDEHFCFENHIIESITTAEQFDLMKYVVKKNNG